MKIFKSLGPNRKFVDKICNLTKNQEQRSPETHRRSKDPPAPEKYRASDRRPTAGE